MRKIVCLLVVAVLAVGFVACGKGGDNPGGESRMKAPADGGGSTKGAYGFDRAALDYALNSIQKQAEGVKKLDAETREKILKNTVQGLRSSGKYLDEDLTYFEQKLRGIYGL